MAWRGGVATLLVHACPRAIGKGSYAAPRRAAQRGSPPRELCAQIMSPLSTRRSGSNAADHAIPYFISRNKNAALRAGAATRCGWGWKGRGRGAWANDGDGVQHATTVSYGTRRLARRGR